MSRPLLEYLPDFLVEEQVLISVSGSQSAALVIPESAWGITLATIARHEKPSPLLVVTATRNEAENLTSDLKNYLGSEQVEIFPAWETLPFERVSPAIETMGQRMKVVYRLTQAAQLPTVIVASSRALAQHLAFRPEELTRLLIRSGSTTEQEKLIDELVAFGYRREYQVEHRGEFAVRGSILDIWPSTTQTPLRIDFWGDVVDRLCEFGVADQRTTSDRPEVEVFPCREFIPTGTVRTNAEALIHSQRWGKEQWERLAAGELFDGMESWMPWLIDEERLLSDLLDEGSLVVTVEPRRLRDRITDLRNEEQESARALAATWNADDSSFPKLYTDWERLLKESSVSLWTMDAVAANQDGKTIAASGWGNRQSWSIKGVQNSKIVARLKTLLADGFKVVVTADGEGSAQSLFRYLSAEGITLAKELTLNGPIPSGACMTVASLERGFLLSDFKLAVVTETELTGRYRTRRNSRLRRSSDIRIFEDLSVGDHVVHEHHGIARFGGLTTRTLGGSNRDYLILEYRGTDRLYLPTDQIESIRPYSSGEKPTLSRMGGADWERSKTKVRSAVSEVADELVALYKERMTTEGRAFNEDTPWQRELEQSFPYQETEDQIKVIKEVKNDMERSAPMDRLICGDVGFGKTEIAVRAAFKAVQDGFQVAILVPTTLLAQQHLETFRSRFAAYPVRVEMLSRFLDSRDVRRVVRGLADGSVDVVIGTHRLLSDDVKYLQLGLLIVDEEQRFGVKHKEAIKGIRTGVDVLSMTATPIPRTLEMSLTGIRDLSVIETPPADRQPILTFVGDYDESAIAEAIRRELLRDGQVFFVHNRVKDIQQVAERICDLVPEARVAIAHGQMEESLLETVVIDFWDGRYDVLVCTTIIESGIDMPTVNTLVVDRADLLGLGQLHQLRGRVGRAGQRAYAYLFTPPDIKLTEETFERLRTIGETTELGSGFRLAMRDLEIRGAGNLLGVGQSGHVASVGYDLYCQMVIEAVAELSGEKIESQPEIRVEVPVNAYLPEDYVGRSDLRLEAYRKLATAGTDPDPEGVELIRSEWEDRYGSIPPPAKALLDVVRLRSSCVARGIKEVTVIRSSSSISPSLDGFLAKFWPVSLPVSRQVRLTRLHPEALFKEGASQLLLPLYSEDLVTEIMECLQDLVPVLENAT